MSQLTLDNVVRAALMTRTEAFTLNPHAIEPWSEQFALWFKHHLADEANRWLAAKGCAKYLRTGEDCPGPLSDLAACDNCEAAHEVAKVDREEAELRAKMEDQG